MTIEEAKETVIQAGKKLVASGLIARTWGNVSCRINDSHFVITPSGRDYLSLTSKDIVEVAIFDLSYSGSIKPSSEKGIHAEVYKLHPEINFVIHTHQEYASAVSTFNMDSIKISEDFPSLCGEIFCAGYGLPGTKKLCKNVVIALTNSKRNAVIMKNHGALCFGTNHEEAFTIAEELEAACRQFIQKQYLRYENDSVTDPVRMGCFALSKLLGKTIVPGLSDSFHLCESNRSKTGFRLYIDGNTFDVVKDQLQDSLPQERTVLQEAEIHNAIYKYSNSINCIIHTDTPGIISVSCANITLMPLLDDFAQIAGTSVKTTVLNVEKISTALKSSSAVFLQKKGALCCGSTKEDAAASALVVEKNCKALIGAALIGKVKYINRFECFLMRLIYLKKYSKLANIK